PASVCRTANGTFSSTHQATLVSVSEMPTEAARRILGIASFKIDLVQSLGPNSKKRGPRAIQHRAPYRSRAWLTYLRRSSLLLHRVDLRRDVAVVSVESLVGEDHLVGAVATGGAGAGEGQRPAILEVARG